MTQNVQADIQSGPFPGRDGWGRFYRFYQTAIKPNSSLRGLVCGYFWPARWESRIYRLLGVRQFGKIVPTGGIAVRRITRSRMAPYTLSGTSVGAARDFFYRTCIFEMLHLPFLVTLLGLSIHRYLIGRPDLALENLAINLLFNIYPIMHHRNTRIRIVRLLERRTWQTESLRQEASETRY